MSIRVAIMVAVAMAAGMVAQAAASDRDSTYSTLVRTNAYDTSKVLAKFDPSTYLWEMADRLSDRGLTIGAVIAHDGSKSDYFEFARMFPLSVEHAFVTIPVPTGRSVEEIITELHELPGVTHVSKNLIYRVWKSRSWGRTDDQWQGIEPQEAEDWVKGGMLRAECSITLKRVMPPSDQVTLEQVATGCDRD